VRPRAPNNGMHPTPHHTASHDVVPGARVMPGVRLLGRYGPLLIECAGAAGDAGLWLNRRQLSRPAWVL
jgi:hypothetical protein